MFSYIDPSATTALITAVTTAVVALSATFIIFWRKLKNVIQKMFRLNANKNKIVEDKLEIYDDSIVVDEKDLEEDEVITETNNVITNKKRINNKLVISILIPLCMFLVFFISTPLELFVNNSEELYFSFGNFFGMNLLFGLILSGIVFSLIYFLPRKASKYFAYIFLGLTIMLFIQSNFISNSINSMNDASGLKKFMYGFDLIIWIVVLAGSVVAAIFNDKKAFIKIGAEVICAMIIISQLVATVSNVSKDPKTLGTNLYTKDCTNMTIKDLTEVSNESNIIYFVFDKLDERYVRDAYKKNPQAFSELEGFTWFQDYISLYGHTFPGIPTMLSGKTYRAEESRTDFLARCYESTPAVAGDIESGDTPLKELYDAGYKINLYTQNYYVYDINHVPDYINNASVGSWNVNNNSLLSLRMTRFGFTRGLPSLFGEVFFRSQSAENFNRESVFNSENKFKAYKYENKSMYNLLNNSEFSNTNDKVFSLVHIQGAHETASEFGVKKSKKNRANAVVNSLKVLNKYIEYLKSIDKYDCSTIVVAGDHGYADDFDHKLLKSLHTSLLVKPANADKKPLQISKVQSGQRDIWPTIMKSINLTSSKYYTEPSLFELSETENRERTMIWHTFKKTCDEYVYKITGPSDIQTKNIITGAKAKNNKNLDSSFSNNWTIVEHKYYQKYLND